MKEHSIHSKGQGRIFKNKFLESLTKTTIQQNLLIYGSIIVAFVYVALVVKEIPVATTAALFLLAFAVWTLTEYLVHRYVFHWVSESKTIQRFHYMAHGVHHDYPKDTERLLMPPVPGIILASIFFGIFSLIFWIIGYPVLTWAFFPGFFLGYLLYSFMHYAMHRYKPPKFLKALWIHHSLHHYQHPDKGFGVSNIFWDRIFGTMPPKSRR